MKTNTDLSGAAIDVLHALFFRGALDDSDLPSKSGRSELVELGMAYTGYVYKNPSKSAYLTILTKKGQELGISRYCRDLSNKRDY